MIAIGGMLLAGAAACLWPTEDPGEYPGGVLVDPQAPPRDTVLHPSADTWVRQSTPNVNHGTSTSLWTVVNGAKRALVRWDQQAIAGAVGAGALVAARLDFTIENSTWDPSGGKLSVHRMTKPWTELGATYNCAIDSDPMDNDPDCAGETAWNLTEPAQRPWVAEPADSVFMVDEQTGMISFDVTGDVGAFLGGTANYGWVVTLRNDSVYGEVRVYSREGAAPPVLVLTVEAGTGAPAVPEVIVVPDSAEALLVVPPGADSGTLILRDHVHIEFDDTTGGATIRGLFARYGAQIVGGYPLTGAYVIRLPDPGPTYEALEALMAQLRAEPGVAYVYRFVYQEPHELLGRYPNDGPDGLRINWLLDTTDATRALLAIRAPLAWGCETGLYGTPAVGVAIVDGLFKVDAQEFAASPTPRPVVAGVPLETRPRAQGLSHGTSVLGVLGAQGDNQTGIAGVVWSSSLFLHEVFSTNQGAVHAVRDLGAYLINVVLPQATAEPVRILQSSIVAPSDWATSERLARAIGEFVNASPSGRLFVQAAGNDFMVIRSDTASLIKPSYGNWLIQQAMSRLLGTPEADRIILVAAANRDGTGVWSEGGVESGTGATLWTGMTDVLAPGEDILVMVRSPEDYAQPVRTSSGSSLSAPMVSGVAALLMAFDPDMSAEEVKSHIVNGSKERRVAWDSVIPLPSIYHQGGFDLHLLDAFGALSRAARLRSGTPICDFPVYTRDAQLYYERVPGAPVARPVSGAGAIWDVTVAQGGRRLAAATGEGWITFDHLGQLATPLPADVVKRVYLERGTADLLSDSSRIRIGRADGSADTVDLKAAIAPTATGFAICDFAPSATGAWIAVSSRQDYPGEFHPFAWEWSIVPVGQGPSQTSVSRFVSDDGGMPCGPDCNLPFFTPGGFGWSQDGQRLQFALVRGTATLNGITIERSVMRSVTFAGGTPAGALTDLGPVVGRELLWPRFNANGDLLLNERETGSGDCRRTWRNPATGHLAGEDPTAIADCRRDADPRKRFNGPPVVAGARSPRAVIQAARMSP